MMQRPGRSRCAAQTHPNTEGGAASHLVRQGFETYLPRYLKMHRRAWSADVLPVPMPMPMFPGYLFVAIGMAVQRRRPIHSTSSVSGLICGGG
jgi:transcriptional antiterminator RfaH